MAKQIAFDREAREAIFQGVQKLARAVKTTLGPKGRNALLDKGWGAPTITKDGVTVAEDIDLDNPYENMGAQMLKEVASKASDEAGDGTTTATILAEAIYGEGLKYITAGANPMAVKRGIDSTVGKIVEELHKISKPVSGAREVEQIATVASNNDTSIGKMIAQAMDKVGKDGVITVEESKGLDTTVDVVEGMQFDRGFLSPHFVNNPDEMKVVFENPLILVYEDKISNLAKFVPFLEKVASQNKPVLLIAEDVDGEALATLVVNKLRGVFQCAAVKAPGYGDRRKAMLGDIAVLTGARVYYKDLGVEMENIQISELGSAKKVEMTAEQTTIIRGKGDAADVSARVKQIRREMEESSSDYDREKLQERLAKLTGGVAELNIGAATETELKEKKARVEDALHATRAAVEEGVVPGGGVALVRACDTLSGKLRGDEAFGALAVKKALEAPLRQIATNAGVNGAIVLRKVRTETGAFGYNAVRDEYGDMTKAGILDPTKVTRTALQLAGSIAGLMLTTNAVISQIPEEDKKDGMGDEDMEGMY
jgi:chaperonin GroEL